MNLASRLCLAFLVTTQYSFAICNEWSSKKIGNLDNKIINEASGLVTSALQKGKLIWSNDSGGDSALFATNIDGKFIKMVKLVGFNNTDFEAIASGPCPSNQSDTCLYVGDIGDGIGWRSDFKVGIFKESDFWASSSIKPEQVINFSYPSRANNAEAMVVTPEGKILILTKTEGSSQVFSLDLEGKVTKLAQVELTGIIGKSRGKEPRITDADVSKDGDKVLILTYGDILEVSMASLVGVSSKNWIKGVDFNVVKGPSLPQQETIVYTADESFIVSTESPDSTPPEIHAYTCK